MTLPLYALWALPLFLALIALEVAWFRRKRREYPWRESLVSTGVWIGRIVTSIAGAGLLALIYDAIWQATPLRLPLDTVWAWAVLFAGVEFSYYWFHRCSHEIRWMWATHSVHHSAEEIHLVAAYRLGWTSTLSGAWLFYLPLIAVGFHPAAVVLMISINLIYQFWLHTEAIRRMPRWFEYVFNTPSHHRVHHAVNPAYLDTNYGGIVILFDRWFGTFSAERDEDPCRYGLVDPIRSRNPVVIALREWGRIARDVWSARGWRARLGHAFGRPGWRPGGGGHTTAEIRKVAGLTA